MADLAKLVVKLEADSAKLRADLDKANKKLGTFSSAADKSAKAASRIGKAFGAALVTYGISKTFSAIIDNTIEQERVASQLEATLKSTGNYTPELSANLQEYAAQLQSVTTYGDEAIIGSQSLLLTFRQISGDVFPRAEMAVLDVATAMGTDLKSAAIQVGKALNDPATGMSALSRSGITFTEAQKDLVKGFVETNQLAKAQGVILTELEAQFGGSAAAAKNTLGGSITSLQNTFGDLLEGDKGSTTEVIASIKDLEKTLNSPDVKAGFQELAAGLLSVTSAGAKGVKELVDFNNWLGVVYKKYLGIDFAERSVDSIIRLSDQISELNVDLKELESSGDGKTSAAYYLRSEIARAGKELDSFTKKYQEAIQPSKAPVIDFKAGGGDAVLAVNKALTKSLESAQKETAKTVDSFKKMYDDITAASAKPDASVDVNDVDYARIQAQKLLSGGDVQGAIDKAKQGFDLIEQMKNAGNLSDDLVAYYAKQFKDIGVKAGDLFSFNAQLDIDMDLAKQSAINAGIVMQEVLTANPLVQQIIVQQSGGTNPSFTNVAASIPDASVPTQATQQASATQYKPAIIKMPDGSSHTVYGDAATIDNFAKQVQKESMKRGAR